MWQLYLQSGLLKVQPEAILAKDQDSLNSVIRYSFVNGKIFQNSVLIPYNAIEFHN